ncbi:hypothetical protein [Actinomadura rayongensis]|uniref:DUF732 domain-containing protein n=1 Tax=Actinomadura rayongensis TaxID=1429076 RepID=A0A6I4W824_9ACTN|nr:hypothetical protein [Actinomadura rayongensis]MXQ62882.1 hypothetical protein [Actinomadura rayongensis]
MKRLIAAAVLPGCLLMASGCSSDASAKDATAHRVAAQAPAAQAADTVIAVRKDGHKITRSEFLRAASKDNRARSKPNATRACKAIKAAFTRSGGKIVNDRVFTRTCLQGLMHK